MDNDEQEKMSVMDKLWDQLNLLRPMERPRVIEGKPTFAAPFLGHASSVSFKRKHPFDHDVAPTQNHSEHTR